MFLANRKKLLVPKVIKQTAGPKTENVRIWKSICYLLFSTARMRETFSY